MSLDTIHSALLQHQNLWLSQNDLQETAQPGAAAASSHKDDLSFIAKMNSRWTVHERWRRKCGPTTTGRRMKSRQIISKIRVQQCLLSGLLSEAVCSSWVYSRSTLKVMILTDPRHGDCVRYSELHSPHIVVCGMQYIEWQINHCNVNCFSFPSVCFQNAGSQFCSRALKAQGYKNRVDLSTLSFSHIL